MMNIDSLELLSREKLAQLAREYMLFAQFNSRTGYAALRINHGDDAYKDTAIDNWMAVSPIYTRRMQRAMHLRGESDVETILKGMQLECGLSHQYFDAGFAMRAREEGEFWLNSCGPLLETEPRGEEAVLTMCHDIEDPTFDATAFATNPRARVRPIHRPPRASAEQSPHCHWRVFIDESAEPLMEPEVMRLMNQTLLAGIEIARPCARDSGGLDYYDVPIFEQLQLERFSQAALLHICKELAVQIHLLVNSLGLVISRRYGEQAARAVTEFQMIGSARVISERLAHWLGCEQGGIDALSSVIGLHPAFQPSEYVACDINRSGDDRLVLRIPDCAALRETQPFGWHQLLLQGVDTGLQSLVQGVDSRAVVQRMDGQTLTWEVCLEQELAQAEEHLAVQVAKGTVLYQTRLENHIQLLQLAD